MSIAVFSLGCKVNQYEADAVKAELAARGHTVYAGLVPADIYVINTCAVTAEAERKSRQCISRALRLNPAASIFIMGCASQKNAEPFSHPNVKWVLGTGGKNKVAELIEKETQHLYPLPKEYEEISLREAQRTRAYVKIQDGCDNFCSYCIVPYLRGRSRSRQLTAVVDEVNALSEKTKEIVLTGVNLSAYGRDIGTDLPTLIRSLAGVSARIRLGSFYVESVNTELLDALFSLGEFCPHFHLSLQSGDDDVLAAMNRHYDTAEYAKKIELIRSYDRHANVTTDVITAFPAETDEMHRNTVEFLRAQGFGDVHVFPYSRREGTVAAKMKPLSSDVVTERKDELAELKRELRTKYHSSLLSLPQKILTEEAEGKLYAGYSQYYVRCFTKAFSEDIIEKTAVSFDGNGLYF